MMKTVQLIETSPEEMQEAILSGLRKEIEVLKKDFQPKEPTVFLTRSEVKDMLKVDQSTVFNWTKKGILKSYGISGRVYYKRHEVEQAIIALNV